MCEKYIQYLPDSVCVSWPDPEVRVRLYIHNWLYEMAYVILIAKEEKKKKTSKGYSGGENVDI